MIGGGFSMHGNGLSGGRVPLNDAELELAKHARDVLLEAERNHALALQANDGQRELKEGKRVRRLRSVLITLGVRPDHD